jgi:hypothetical protein
VHRRVCLGLTLALTACKPTIILEEPEPERRPSDPADDPLVEHEAVREAVRGYAGALGRRDVVAASALVVDETFAFYEQLRVAALEGTREQLEALDLMTILMVLQIRSQVGRAELQTVDGRGLFGFAVTEGFVGEGLDAVPLDDVWLDEARTSAQIRLEGEPIAWLRKTDAGWQMDIPEMVLQLGPAIEAVALEQVVADGKLRTAYTLLEIGSDEYLDIAILEGPLELEGEPKDTP